MYGKSAEDLLYKVQSITFSSAVPHSELRPITMDTLVEAKRSFQQDLANAAPKKQKAKQHPVMTTAVVDRSRLPNQKFASRLPAIVKQEQPPESSFTVAASGLVTTAKVAFIGQPNDPESRKKRKCEMN